MKLGDNLQVAKLYLQYKGKTANTAVKKFQGRAVAKLNFIDSKIKLTDKLKAIGKKITERKTTIKITIKQYNDHTTTKVKIKGNKNFNLDSLTSFLEKQENKSEISSLADKPADTIKTPKKNKPAVPPRPTVPPKPDVSSKPAVPPRPTTPTKPAVQPKPTVPPKPAVQPKPTVPPRAATPTKPAVAPKPTKNTTINKSLSKDQQSKSNATADIPKPPPVPTIKTIKDTAIDLTAKKSTTKDVSRNKLLQEIKNFDPKKNLKKANTSHQTENTKSETKTNLDIREDLKKHLSIRRSSINPDD